MTRSIYDFADSTPTADAGSAITHLPGESPRIGVIRNPRSRHNVERASSATPESGIKLALPDGRAALAGALRELAEGGLDLLVIDGGDGTVRDVLTLGQTVFTDGWPVLAVLPKGKTNALALDLGLPEDFRLPAALAAWQRGKRTVRRPIVVTPLDRPGEPGITGFIYGAGAFTTAIRDAQEAHKVGAFNALAVALTSVWGVTQALFGRDSNPWRRGSAMDLTLGEAEIPAPRARHGNPAYRAIALATTLAKLPMGVKPFGRERAGLKLAVIDLPLRRVLLSFPLILSGRLPRWLPGAGYWVHDTPRFAFTTDAPFIVDGEAFPPGRYRVEEGAELTFAVP